MLTSPAIAYTSHPTDALFKAHFTASVMLTVYLMGCSTLLVAIVLGWNYSEQFNLTLQWLPHTAAFALLLWLTGGFGCSSASSNMCRRALASITTMSRTWQTWLPCRQCCLQATRRLGSARLFSAPPLQPLPQRTASPPNLLRCLVCTACSKAVPWARMRSSPRVHPHTANLYGVRACKDFLKAIATSADAASAGSQFDSQLQG